MRQYRFYNIHNFVTFMIQENESSWSRIQIDNNMKPVKYNYKKKKKLLTLSLCDIQDRSSEKDKKKISRTVWSSIQPIQMR